MADQTRRVLLAVLFLCLLWAAVAAGVVGAARGAPVEQIVFASNLDGDFDLFLLDAVRLFIHPLTRNTVHDANPVWSPDGRTLAFVSNRDGGFYTYLLSLEGEGSRRLTADAEEISPIAWSPDGRWLSVTGAGGGVRVVDVEAGSVSRFRGTTPLDYAPTWSPEGDRIAVANLSIGGGIIDVIETRGKRTRLSGIDSAGQPRWSPGGEAIAFFSTISGYNRVFIAAAATGDTAAATPGGGHDLWFDFAPDGGRLAINRYAFNGVHELGIYNVEAERFTRLALLPGEYAHIAWSPDGAWIAVSDGRRLFRVRVEDAHTETLISDNLHTLDFAWRP